MVVDGLMGEIDFTDFGEMAEDSLWCGLSKEAHRGNMSLCLELAERGRGRVSPNPMVGAVLVRDGVVLAEGWHAYFGGAHAERMLFESLGDAGDYSDCILYVSLEPCAHFGKTPPCANLILEKGVGAVVIGVLDPNPMVSGRGAALLSAAGVAVLEGVLEAECQQLNGSFWVNQILGRTAVVAKWAETGDGFIGRIERTTTRPSSSENRLNAHNDQVVQNGRVLISGKEAGLWVHNLRAGVDAILVGVNTWNLDKPTLNVRGIEVSKQPIRIVLDQRLRGDYSAESVDRSDAPLWVIYDLNLLDGDEAMCARELQFLSLSEASISGKLVGWGLELTELGSASGHGDLSNTVEIILQWLYEAQGLGVILVEGGASILQSFLDVDCVDDIHILRNSQMHLGTGIKSPNLDRVILRRGQDLGADEHWVWHRKIGGDSIEAEGGDRAK